MIKSLKSSDKSTDRPSSAGKLLLITIADTTWRAFVPTIGGTFVGIGLDHWFNTAPWWTVAMIAIGFATSILLVIIQIRGVKK